MAYNGKYVQEDWEKEMEDAQNAASSLKSAIPPNADDLRPPADPRQTEISMIQKSNDRMKEFKRFINRLNNELCKINSVYIKELKKNPNAVNNDTFRRKLDEKRTNILLLIAEIEKNYDDYIKNTSFEKGVEEIKLKMNQLYDAAAKKQIHDFNLLCDTSIQGDNGCSCAIMGGRRTRRGKSRKNTRKSTKKYIRKNKRRTQKSRRKRKTKCSRKTRK